MLPTMRGLPGDVHLTLYQRAHDQIDEQLEALATRLSQPGLTVDVRLMQGRPASEIVDEARRLGADLIVIGSRGRGAIASTILGSVAAEVIDHASCPVLVSRVPRISSILLADDGSDGARQAEEVLTSWPPLRLLPVRVVSVIDLAPFVGPDMSVTLLDADTYQRTFDELRDLRLAIARAAAQRLGDRAVAEVREGFVTNELIAAAAAAGADLIVVGSRGETGLARLLLGSVARGVMHAAPVSVLVTRQRVSLAPG
jgi:nucleotide-binding universal stress UspA family protein